MPHRSRISDQGKRDSAEMGMSILPCPCQLQEQAGSQSAPQSLPVVPSLVCSLSADANGIADFGPRCPGSLRGRHSLIQPPPSLRIFTGSFLDRGHSFARGDVDAPFVPEGALDLLGSIGKFVRRAVIAPLGKVHFCCCRDAFPQLALPAPGAAGPSPNDLRVRDDFVVRQVPIAWVAARDSWDENAGPGGSDGQPSIRCYGCCPALVWPRRYISTHSDSGAALHRLDVIRSSCHRRQHGD